jgi:hypothetical protein
MNRAACQITQSGRRSSLNHTYMKSNYEERKANRLEWAKQQALKHDEKSNQAYKHSHKLASMIPMGQPILVDHYSAPMHRRHIQNIDNAMRKSVEHQDTAAYYRGKVSAMESNRAISSDDPQAIEKLKAKLAALVQEIEGMKAANKKQRGSYEPFELSNRNAEKRRLEKRITILEKSAQRPHKEIIFRNEKLNIRVVQNPTDNRIQLFFDGKPADEICQLLNKHNFKFSRAAGEAWQRFLNNAGIDATHRVLRELNATAVKKDD